MARSLPKVSPFFVTVDLKLKWPELPSGPNYPALPYTAKFRVWLRFASETHFYLLRNLVIFLAMVLHTHDRHEDFIQSVIET